MSIYIYLNNQPAGPFAENAIRQMLQSEQISPDTWAVRQGESNWRPLKTMFSPADGRGNVSNLPGGNQVHSNPQKKSGSKIWLIALLGTLGIFLLAAVGVASIYLVSAKRSMTSETIANQGKGDSKTNNDQKPTLSLNPADIKALQNKAEELALMSPPLQTAGDPVLKGKVAIVEKSDRGDARILGFDYTGSKYSQMDVEEYGISPVRLATRVEEIETLVQILCQKGKLVGRYEGGISGYANNCKVSVIDYNKPAVTGQKSFTNTAPPKSISSVYETLGEYVFPMPDEVNDYIADLPLERLAAPIADIPFDDDGGSYGKYKPFMDLAGELARISFPVEQDANASLKGKIAVAIKEASGRAELKGFDVYGKEFYSFDYEKWGVGKEKLAERHDQIDTLVQINCRKGDQIGIVKRTKVFSNQCVVSIVDYKASKVVSQKTFENKQMYKDIDTDVFPSQYTVINPFAEIEQFIKGFPKS